MTALRRIFTFAAVCAATHCGNSGIYDEALTEYYRVVRSGLNEWYPLNGNLSSRVGSFSGTATGSYTNGVNRAGENAKAICITSTPNMELNFNSAPTISPPFTVTLWVKVNQLPALTKALFQKGTSVTSTHGFKIEIINPSGVLQAAFSNGIAGDAVLSGPVATMGQWYYVAFSYDGGSGSFYVGQYGATLTHVGTAINTFGNVTPLRAFGNTTNTVDGCIDDFLHYSRALSADEVKQNFLTLE